MDGPLWTETHAPDLADLPQPKVREYLQKAAEEPINLVLHGPPGCGKTAAVRAMARDAHEDPDNDLIEINVADFFGRSKTEIKNDPRFESFLRGKSSLSKRDMINHVLKESAAYAPVSGDYKTILLDNAEDIREDFQQALRRVMERHHETTQFVIATRQPSKLIPPIKSRCFLVPVREPPHDEMTEILTGILDDEDADYDREGVEYIAGYADGDLRQAILCAQTTVEQAGEVTMETAYETLGDIGAGPQVEEMLDDAEAGEFTDARSTLDDLLVDEGMSGDEVLDELRRIARSRYAGERLAQFHRLAGDIDRDLAEGTNDRLHIGHLLAEVPEL